jgi:hypothetical protein
MFVAMLDEDGMNYALAEVVRWTCCNCGEQWWEIDAWPNDVPPRYKPPDTWKGGVFVRETRVTSVSVFAVSSILRRARLYIVGGRVYQGLFTVGRFRECGLIQPEPGWEMVAQYSFPWTKPSRVLAMWRAYGRDRETESISDLKDKTAKSCSCCSERQPASG